MTPSTYWSVRVSAAAEQQWANGQLVSLTRDGETLDIVGLSPLARSVMNECAAGIATDRLTAVDDPGRRLATMSLVAGLTGTGWLERTLTGPTGDVARLEVVGRPYRASMADPPGGDDWQLNRFALLRREGEALVLECPTALSRFVLLDDLLPAVVACLTTQGPIADRAWPVGVESQTARQFAAALWQEGFLTSRRAAASDPWDEWSFHDLLFQSRTRTGRFRQPYGGTYPQQGRRPPTPALTAPEPGASSVTLPHPEIEEVVSRDTSLTAAMESRRSRRRPGPRPLSLPELGEFLFRTARVRDSLGGPRGEVTDRPYPGGGAAYELELYLLISRVQGLEQGIYKYDPAGHALTLLAGWTPKVSDMATTTARSAPPGLTADVTFLITARMPRLTYKYTAVPLAIALKDTGVLFQSFYLVAEAMGLAACAVGGGEHDALQRTIGVSAIEEPQVGEFLLSSRNPDEVPTIDALRQQLDPELAPET